LLKFCYLGWNYSGYVVQDDTIETIEYYLFKALKKVCLIDSRETSNYNRCGRTDKGVSAFDQVVSLDLRSKFEFKDQLTEEAINGEINYCTLLNKVLPKEIRAISWMPLISSTYSARFDCTNRTYRYFFPRGTLDVNLMEEACKSLLGAHDFRNLCKMDVGNGVVNYIRRIDIATIKEATKNETEDYDMFYLEIKGSAFLWHMIRCIVAVLFLIGEKKESPDVIKELLDIENNEQKPQYSLASEIPLNLFFCNFREESLTEDDIPRNIDMANKWVFNEETLRDVITDMQEHWCDASVKSAMVFEMLRVLNNEYSTRYPDKPKLITQMKSLNRDCNRRDYMKLTDRQKCSTLEERIDHYTKKRKLIKEA
jgi:tRNA pseudouridine38/39 synthase